MRTKRIPGSVYLGVSNQKNVQNYHDHDYGHDDDDDHDDDDADPGSMGDGQDHHCCAFVAYRRYHAISEKDTRHHFCPSTRMG